MADAKACDVCGGFFKHDEDDLECTVEHRQYNNNTFAMLEVYREEYGGSSGNRRQVLDVDQKCIARTIRSFMAKYHIRELPETALEGRYHVLDRESEDLKYGCEETVLDSVVTGEISATELFQQFKGKSIRVYVEVIGG